MMKVCVHIIYLNVHVPLKLGFQAYVEPSALRIYIYIRAKYVHIVHVLVVIPLSSTLKYNF
jgi:hypothetical protein